MYYAESKTNNSSRMVGIVSTVAATVIATAGLLSAGKVTIPKLTKTEVVVIEDTEVVEEEPPPPPPVDVELPPPPPQVVLPQFTFDVPPPPNAITQVVAVEKPVAAAPRPVAPPPPPKPTIVSRPKQGRNFESVADWYPAASLRAEEEGVSTLSICVDAQGRISQPQLVKSSGFDRLDQAAVKEIVRQRMIPAKDSTGANVPFCPMQLDIQWQIPED
jgi:periplasmic protein TonB